ncbi:MAG: hypothetical protein GVY32_09475 [Gammaproteobacteria bacterium]|jgi:signal transduction histidine kinase|nr:hypothetical protein [Gammaproteobacteria bacterium]
MRLRTRLALISLLILLVPLAIWQLVHSLERSLRESYQANLVDTARSVAGRLAQSDYAWPSPGGLYVHPAERGFAIDGRRAEWEPWLDFAQRLGHETEDTPGASVIAAERGRRLHLLVDVEDERLVLADPENGAGDRLMLGIAADGRDSTVEIIPLAPGWLEVASRDGLARVQAALQPTERGWLLELVVVEPAQPDAVDLAVTDVDDDGTRAAAGATRKRGFRPLIRRSPQMASALEGLLPANARGWLVNPQGWVLAGSAVRAPGEADGGETGSELLTTLAAGLLGALPRARDERELESARLVGDEIGDRPAAVWYQAGQGTGFVVSAAAPLTGPDGRLGHVVIERPADRFVSAAYRALLQLFVVALLGMLVVAAVTIQFGVGLSRRIRRLKRAAEDAVSPDGRVRGALRISGGADELSELGRDLAAMIDRQQEHQEHLQALASRLSHELRTPLAMIRTSLDNLSEVEDEAARERYRIRAEAGCRRLQNTFDAMSQAARIEASLTEEPLTTLDLGKLVDHYVQGCRQTFGTHRFAATVPTTRPARIRASGEQVAQLLDKLVENAVDFTPTGGQITLRVVPQGPSISLQVDNPGSRLPENLRSGQLFDSMTASRQSGDERSHLGLGLHIVRLIAGRHGASCRAVDRPDGVRFQVDFPRAAASGPRQDPL